MADLSEVCVCSLILLTLFISLWKICFRTTKFPTRPVLQTVKCRQMTNNNFHDCYSWFINYFQTYNLLLVYRTFEDWIKSHCIPSFCIRRHEIQPLVNDNRQISDRLLMYRTFKDWIKTHSIDKLVSYLTRRDEMLPLHINGNNLQTSNLLLVRRKFKDWIMSHCTVMQGTVSQIKETD